jgi:hypothetical protein
LKVFDMKKAITKKQSINTGNAATVQRRKRKTLDQVRNEGFDNGVRNCIEALLTDGNSRDYIADVFMHYGCILFPAADTPDWGGLFAFDDWSDWVEADTP